MSEDSIYILLCVRKNKIDFILKRFKEMYSYNKMATNLENLSIEEFIKQSKNINKIINEIVNQVVIILSESKEERLLFEKGDINYKTYIKKSGKYEKDFLELKRNFYILLKRYENCKLSFRRSVSRLRNIFYKYPDVNFRVKIALAQMIYNLVYNMRDKFCDYFDMPVPYIGEVYDYLSKSQQEKYDFYELEYNL